MKYPKSFPNYSSICLLLLGMGAASVSPTLEAADITLPQSDARSLSLRASVMNSTDRIIVKYREPVVNAAKVNAMVARTAQIAGQEIAQVGMTHNGARILKLKRPLALGVLAAITQKIKGDAGIEYAEPDLRLMPLYTPNDPRYNEQWHYYETTGGIDLPAAWDLTQGENSVVAVVDTGYLPHQDLLPNILAGYDMVSNLSIANDGDGRDADPLDPGDYAPFCGMPRSSWHGTHVAGTVAAVGNNGIGVTGIAFRAQLLPVRVLGKCGGYLSDISDGIVWASGADVSGTPRNPHPANVISMSLGGPSSICPQTFQRAIDTARQQGATVVVAAGNESRDSATTTPANCEGVISVAASTRTGERASFSNYGDLVDIAAPGEEILSTYNNGIIAPRNDSYEYMSGTSMATPHVSGVAALLYAVKPGITPDQVEQILKQTARPFPNSCAGCGSGILDAAAALERASAISDISFRNSADYPIPNFRFVGASSPIEISLDGKSGGIDVSVDIKHPDIRELIVALSDPLGQIHVLKRFGGQQATDLSETYPLNMGQVQAAGTWQLRVFDFGSRGDGYIDNWSITFHR